MTQAGSERITREEQDVLLLLLSVVLMRRGLIAKLMVGGGAIGLAVALLSPRIYISRGTMQPHGYASELTSLTKAAGEFGFQVPSGLGDAWGPGVYRVLLQSQRTLAPIVVDTFDLRERGGKRAPLSELLGVQEADSAERVEQGVAALRRILRIREIIPIGAVQVEVGTPWPGVSQAIVQRLIESVHEFNRTERRSQAIAEREFLETRVEEAHRSLQAAEYSLQTFLQANRALESSPELRLEHDRRQRAMTLAQSLYVQLVEAREVARLREVRDTPVITVLESPILQPLPESRRLGLSVALGLLAGGLVGLAVGLVGYGLEAAKERGSHAERRFLRLLGEVWE